MRTQCRKCRSMHYPLTPVGYCYLCFSRFGSATQVAMLLMAVHPFLPAEQQAIVEDVLSLHWQVW